MCRHILFCSLLALSLGSAASLFADDRPVIAIVTDVATQAQPEKSSNLENPVAEVTSKADDAGSKWKVILNSKMDAASRNFTEMSRLANSTSRVRNPMSQSRVYSDERFLFVHLRFYPADGSVSLPRMQNFQFGYGDVFPLNTVLMTCSNGAGREEPNCAYVKYCRDF